MASLNWYDPRLPVRLWNRIEAQGNCYVWTGSTRNGYGQVRYKGQNWVISRLVWTLTQGPIPEDRDVLHECDNPPCIRCLFLGTPMRNSSDMVYKGRSAYGEKCAAAKLTEAQIKEIRRAYQAKEYLQRELAEMYAVTQPTISSITRGITWLRQW